MGSLLDSPVKKSPRRAARPLREAPEASSAGRDLRSPTPDEPRPPASALFIELHGSLEAARNESRRTLEKYEDTKPAYFFPPHHRERKADTRVPRHKTRVYMRTEVHLSVRLKQCVVAHILPLSAIRLTYRTKLSPTQMTNSLSGKARSMLA